MKRIHSLNWPVFAIFVVWCIFCFPFFYKGDIPFPSKYLVTTFAPWSTAFAMPVKSASMPDVITQIYPWKQLTIESWKRGHMPLWNPYSFAGTQHAGNYQTAVFSPINILFLFLSTPIAWSWAVLLQPLLAGLCMYLYLTSERVSKISSLTGALAFMFCGFMVVWMAYETLGYAALFLPLCLYAVNMHRDGKKWWSLPLLASSIALSLVSGHFQISIYVIGYVILYIIFGDKDRRIDTQIPPLLFIALGIGIATPQLWETYRAYTQSVRSVSFSKGEIIPWQYLITFFAPDFYGHPVTRNDWFGHYAEWAGFIGVIPLLFSLCAIFIAKHTHKIFFMTVGILSLLLALPTWLTDLLYMLKIPVLSTSSASRIIMLTSFSLATLCAYGFDAIMDLWKHRDVKVISRICIVACIFLFGFWFMVKGGHLFDADSLAIAVRNSYLPSGLLIGALLLLLGGIYLPKKYIIICLYGLLMLTAVDTLRFAIKWMPFEPKEYIYPKMGVIDKITSASDVSTARVMGNFGNELSGMYHLQGVDGYDAMYKGRYGEFMSYVSDRKMHIPSRSVVLLDKHGIFTEKVLQLLGVRYYLHKVSDGRFSWAYPFWEYSNYDSIWKDPTYEIFQNTAAYPRAFLASSYTVIDVPEQIMSTLFSDSFDRRNTVVLEEKPDVSPEIGDGEVVIASYFPEKVSMQIKTNVPKLLFLSDVYDSGWKAYVNGTKAKIYRANYAFRAVSVPKGAADVVMVYEPYSVWYGLYISGISIGILIFYIIKKIYAHRIL